MVNEENKELDFGDILLIEYIYIYIYIYMYIYGIIYKYKYIIYVYIYGNIHVICT